MVLLLLTFFFGILLGLFIGIALWYRSRPHDEAKERRKRCKHIGYPIPKEGLTHSYGWFQNSRGMLIYHQEYIPTGEVKGVVGFCHGFGTHSHSFCREVCLRYVKRQYAVIAYDAEGHGFSDGLHCYVEKIQDIAADVSQYFESQMLKPEFKDLPLFVIGESMGGAVAFNLSTSCSVQHVMKGLVLAYPMVRISDDVKPPEYVIHILTFLSHFFPYAPIVPIADLSKFSFKRIERRLENIRNPLQYHGMPRIRTALAMRAATEDIDNRMEELKLPVFILHGEADKVTCPEHSRILFNRCSSKDKTLKFYPDGWHALLQGESEEMIQLIIDDTVKWMNDRL